MTSCLLQAAAHRSRSEPGSTFSRPMIQDTLTSKKHGSGAYKAHIVPSTLVPGRGVELAVTGGKDRRWCAVAGVVVQLKMGVPTANVLSHLLKRERLQLVYRPQACKPTDPRDGGAL